MTDRTDRPPEVGGMGHSVKRKEDPRFIRGKGEYIEDVNLPGSSGSTSSAARTPTRRSRASTRPRRSRSRASSPSITGKDLEGYSLHWMPTLAGDKQMVLPTDTVMYQARRSPRSSPRAATRRPTASPP